LNPINNYHMWD